MYQMMNQKRNEKSIEKRNQEEVQEEREVEQEEEEEEIRRRLSNKRYVCSCIIEDSSLTFTTVFWCLSLIPGSGFRLKKEDT